MNRGIHRVGVAMLLLFLALVGQLSYLQLVRAEDLEEHPGNSRVFLRDIRRPRGTIVSSDGAILAFSEPSGDELEQQRVYPPETAELFAHIVGYQTVTRGNTGVEAEYNDFLVGREFEVTTDRLSNLGELGDLFRGVDAQANIILTVNRRAQELARDGLAGRRGSVVVLDVATGAVVAAYSNPTYDPNPLASHDESIATGAYNLYTANAENPMLARAWREFEPPGSTFKVTTTAIALEAGITTLDRVFPAVREIDVPQTTDTLENFGGNSCGGTLVDSFRQSCNTTFGLLGLELNETYAARLKDFGVNSGSPPTDLRPDVTESVGPPEGSFRDDNPSFARAAIGQDPVKVTPLEMAMITQAIANDGVMMVPHVLDHAENVDGEVIAGTRYRARQWKRAMQPATAATLTDLMVEVVNNGTGRNGQIAGVQVAGKTGTAQVEGEDPHAWFIAFAPADNPVYAIAVLVENGGDLGSEATGGRVAAPIAASVLSGLFAQAPPAEVP